MGNTRVDYLYRDGSNYKNWKSVIVVGEVTEEMVTTIMDCLDDGEYFIPQQVGLPDAHFAEFTPNEDDHAWCELCVDDFKVVDAPATIGLTAEDLVERFKAAKGNWDESLYDPSQSQPVPKQAPANTSKDANLIDIGTTSTAWLVFADGNGQTGLIRFGRNGKIRARLCVQTGFHQFKTDYSLAASGTKWLKLFDDNGISYGSGLNGYDLRLWEIYRKGPDKCLIRIVL